MEATTWKKINGDTWHLLSKYQTPDLRAVLTRDADKNYSMNITHLKEDFKLGQHKHRIGSAQTAAYEKWSKFEETSPLVRRIQLDKQKEAFDDEQREAARAKVVRCLAKQYTDGKDGLASNVEALRDRAVVKGYRDSYWVMGRILEAEAKMSAAMVAVGILLRDDGWENYERDVLAEAARVFSNAHSTNSISNANEMEKGKALRHISETFKYSDALKRAFEVDGDIAWDFEADIKAALPELFPKEEVTA